MKRARSTEEADANETQVSHRDLLAMVKERRVALSAVKDAEEILEKKKAQAEALESKIIQEAMTWTKPEKHARARLFLFNLWIKDDMVGKLRSLDFDRVLVNEEDDTLVWRIETEWSSTGKNTYDVRLEDGDFAEVDVERDGFAEAQPTISMAETWDRAVRNNADDVRAAVAGFLVGWMRGY